MNPTRRPLRPLLSAALIIAVALAGLPLANAAPASPSPTVAMGPTAPAAPTPSTPSVGLPDGLNGLVPDGATAPMSAAPAGPSGPSGPGGPFAPAYGPVTVA